MEGIFVPVPNQPLYVWPIRTSAIFSRGFVRGNRRLMSLGLHGHILLGGTQSILPMYPSIESSIANKIYMYGCPLYTWYGRTPYGGSRYRILFIVWIWNYIVSNTNIIAQSGGVDQHVGIYAQSAIDTSFLNVSHFLIPRVELDQVGYVAYTTDRIHRYHYALSAGVESQTESGLKLLARVKQITEMSARFMVDTHAEMRGNVFRLLVSPLAEESGVYKIMASTRPVFMGNITKFIASLAIQKLERVVSLATNLSRSDYGRIYKLQIQTHPGYVERSIRLQTLLGSSQYDRLSRMSIHTLKPYQERMVKLSVRTPESWYERIIKFSVRAVPSEIEEVMAFISTNLASHFHSNGMHVRSNLGSQPAQLLHLYSYTHKTERSSVDVISALRELTQHQGRVSMQTDKHVHETKDSRFMALPIERRNHKIHTHMDIEHKEEAILTGAVLEPKTERQELQYQIQIHEQQVGLRLNALVLQEQWHRIEIDVLPLLAEHRIRFFPSQAPLVEQVGVMITVCRTHILSYLNFVPDELKEAVDVLVSTCSYTTASLLQWYLHGNRISNEGGNEIIFDLGEVDPIGPIPPVPSRQWEGGYVEDPFKGISYQPSSGSTGFGSPSAEKWVSNTQMWWGSTGNPFVDPEL